MSEIEICLKERDTLPSHAGLSPIDPVNSTLATGSGDGPVPATNDATAPASSTTAATPSRTAARSANGVVGKLDKRQIEQRIEEDRERHKRLRESIWAVKAEGDGEFEKLWEEASDVAEDDYLAAEEDAMERRTIAAMD